MSKGYATTPVQAWKNASLKFAQGAAGDVKAVIGKNMRPGNVWDTVELPALKANPNVRSITVVDPLSNVETVVFKM